MAALRLEVISAGEGITIPNGSPQANFKIKRAFNTYKIPMNSIFHPCLPEVKVIPNKVLKKLTSINLVAYCDQCTPVKGMVVVDNMAFEK